MFKRIVLVFKKPELSGDEFRRYYLQQHGPIVARMPGLRRYVQNPTYPGPDGREPDISGVAEIWYDDEASFRRAMASSEAAASNRSLEQFVDTSRTMFLAVEEVQIEIPHPDTETA